MNIKNDGTKEVTTATILKLASNLIEDKDLDFCCPAIASAAFKLEALDKKFLQAQSLFEEMFKPKQVQGEGPFKYDYSWFGPSHEFMNPEYRQQRVDALRFCAEACLKGQPRVHYSKTTFKENGDPILVNADGTRSIFCDVDE